jgi:uncharacterized RDD family membrane protein YckC
MESENKSTEKYAEYAGFARRASAHLIDSVLWILITLPVLFWIYGNTYLVKKTGYDRLEKAIEYAHTGDVERLMQLQSQRPPLVMGWMDTIINYVLPLFVVVFFWYYRSATPGKMILRVRIVDANSLGKPTIMQLVIRSFGYLVSMLPLGFGFIWVLFDPRGQGWHDKMAKTVVLWEPRTPPEFKHNPVTLPSENTS